MLDQPRSIEGLAQKGDRTLPERSCSNPHLRSRQW